jgi:hypothetical protein
MIGFAQSVDSPDNTVAPRNAPTAPGPAILATTGQSTFRKRQCDTPDARFVPSSLKCTEAEAATGVRPANTSRVDDVTP